MNLDVIKDVVKNALTDQLLKIFCAILLVIVLILVAEVSDRSKANDCFDSNQTAKEYMISCVEYEEFEECKKEMVFLYCEE